MSHLDNAAELVMEGVDGGVEHWDKLKDRTARVLSGDHHHHHHRHQHGDRHRDDDRAFPYDDDRDYRRRKSTEYFEERRGRHRSPTRALPAAYADRSTREYRASSVDRLQFPDNRLTRYREHEPYALASPDDYRPTRDRDRDRDHRRHRRDSFDDSDGYSKLKRKGHDYLSLDNDVTAAVATGIVTIGTVFAASKLYDTYKGRNKQQQQISRSRSRRRR